MRFDGRTILNMSCSCTTMGPNLFFPFCIFQIFFLNFQSFESVQYRLRFLLSGLLSGLVVGVDMPLQDDLTSYILEWEDV